MAGAGPGSTLARQTASSQLVRSGPDQGPRSRIFYTEISEQGYHGDGWWAMGMERNNVILRQGQQMSLSPKRIQVHEAARFCCEPPLPEELIFNEETGSIMGVPTMVAETTKYTIRATTADGDCCEGYLKIAVASPLPRIKQGHTTVQFPLLQHIEPLKLMGDAWDPDQKLDFRCNPPLPPGLHLDPSVGEVFGLPEGKASSQTHTITCVGSYGFTAEITISIELLEKPSQLEYSKLLITSSPLQTPVCADRIGRAFNLQPGQTVQIEPLPVHGSSPMSFSAEYLPDSFQIDHKTGVISGRALKALSGTWIVVVSNAAGSCKATIRVTTSHQAWAAPTQKRSARKQRLTRGQSFASFRPQSAASHSEHKHHKETDYMKLLVPANRDRRIIMGIGDDGRRDPLFFRALLERERSKPWFEGEFARFKRRPEAEADWLTITKSQWRDFLARQQGSCLHHQAKDGLGNADQIFCRRCLLRHVDRKTAARHHLKYGRYFIRLSRTDAAVRIQRWWMKLLEKWNSRAPTVDVKKAEAQEREQRVFYHFKHERRAAPRVYQPEELVRRVRAHKKAVTALCVDAMHEYVYTASMDKTVGVWDPYAGQQLTVIGGGTISKKLVKTGGKAELVADGVGHFKGLRAMCISGTRSTIYTGAEDYLVVAWDTATGAGLRQYKGHREAVTCLVQPKLKPVLVSGSADGDALVWNQSSAALVGTLRDGPRGCGPVAAMTYQEGCVYVGYGLDGRNKKKADARAPILGFDIETSTVVVRLAGHVGPVTTCQAVSDSGSQLLCSGGGDRVVRVWDTRLNGKEVLALSGHQDAVSCCAWSSSQHAIFSGSADKTVRGWDVRKSLQVSLLQGHREGVTSVACWGEALVSSCQHGFLYTWCIAGLRELG